MRPKAVYLALCILGTAVPLAYVLPFLRTYGLDASLFVASLFANRVSGFFGLDVIVSALVLWAFVGLEGSRLGIRRLWMPVVATLVVGVSLGLPLFLYLRELRLEAAAMGARSPVRVES
jgi:hypothetical protein